MTDHGAIRTGLERASSRAWHGWRVWHSGVLAKARRESPSQSQRALTEAIPASGSVAVAPQNPTNPAAREDQHGNNTDETAFSGTRQYDCHDGRACPVISKNAGELGW